MDDGLPVIGITAGDPAGIGPEITLKALMSSEFPGGCIPLVIGDSAVLGRARGYTGLDAELNRMTSASGALPGRVNVLDMGLMSAGGYETGKVQASCGKAAYEYILKAVDLALRGDIAAVVTNPINKEAFRKAGIGFPGHTELLAWRTGVKEFSMMFYLDGICVAHVTTHCSLREAIGMITVERVLSHIRLLEATVRGLGIAAPRIAVGGLNPHAGENGMFGDEEIGRIAPAIEKARALGTNASGPYPPDTVFMRAFKGEFDGVVSMLHDHGFVALKSRNFDEGVNITIGLPIIRTSPGHGTAFDIAGRGIASEKGLLAAVGAALLLYRNRKRQDR
jgi:4-hydroxythreonine-4-phosphate dehydrogenase